MKYFRLSTVSRWMVAFLFVTTIGGSVLTTAIPQSVSAASDCAGRFLGFPTWYRGLTDAPPDCNIKTPSDSGGLGNFIWHIGLNIVEIILVAIAYIATAYFLYGGLLFIVSRGNPDGATRARSTILNAIIGLIISMASIALVNFVVGSILK